METELSPLCGAGASFRLSASRLGLPTRKESEIAEGAGPTPITGETGGGRWGKWAHSEDMGKEDRGEKASGQSGGDGTAVLPSLNHGISRHGMGRVPRPA